MEEKTDLRIRKTYKALCDAFVTILEKKRFDDLTVNELCDEAMIRRATFYKHFADKYDFFSFFIRQERDRFIQQIADPESDSIYAHNLYLTQKTLHFFQEHDTLIQNVLKSNMASALLDIFSEEIYTDIFLNLKEYEKNGVTFSVSPELLASFLSGGIFQTILAFVHHPQQFSDDQIVTDVSKILGCLETMTS